MKKLIIVSLFGLLFSFSMSLAQTSVTTRGSSARYQQTSPEGWAPFVGFGAGYTAQNTDLNVEGTPATIKLIGSYYAFENRWLFDLGYGFQSQNFSESKAMDSDISTGALDAAARYQWENRWQGGIIYSQIFDKGANYSANQADAEFLGLQVLREFTMTDAAIGRIGLRALNSINVNDESVNMFLVDFEMGWNPSSRGSLADSSK